MQTSPYEARRIVFQKVLENDWFFDGAPGDDINQRVLKEGIILQEFKDGFKYFARKYLEENREQPFYFVNVSYFPPRRLRHFSPYYSFKDIWVNMPAAIVLPKYSPLTEEMNRYISRMVNAGIVDKIFRDYVLTGGDVSTLNRIAAEAEAEGSLGLTHFLSLFTFYLSLTLLAILMFAWELKI